MAWPRSQLPWVPTGGGDSQKRSRWERWGLSRGKKEKMASQPSIPSSLLQEEGLAAGRPHTPSESGKCSPRTGWSVRCVSPPQPNPPLCFPDFPPIFHIKLKDQVLLEGEALTLCCLPAGSPAPRILWLKGGGLPALPQWVGSGRALYHPSPLLSLQTRGPCSRTVG